MTRDRATLDFATILANQDEPVDFPAAMRVLNQANALPDTIAEVEAQLASQENLKDMMLWALSHPAGTFVTEIVAGVVVQDEFTHDVIVPWRDGLVLVYDTT